MQIPIKITPDNLRDSIIEIRYEPLEHHLVVIGHLYTQLTNLGFKLIPSPSASIRLPTVADKEIKINPTFNETLIFGNENIRIKLSPNVINFNCMGSYLGWEKFSKSIKDVMTALSNCDVVKTYTRVGVRYISQYDYQTFSTNVNFSIRLGIDDITFTNLTFRTEYSSESFKVILNLNTRQSNKKNEPSETLGFIDVDVIKEVGSKNVDVLFEAIEETHSKEKQIFFSLLDEEFIKTLQPKY